MYNNGGRKTTKLIWVGNTGVCDAGVLASVIHPNERTPWDDGDSLSSLESFIRDTYHNRFDRKHQRLINTNESTIINSYILKSCPYCGGKFKLNGYTSNKIQRYKCLHCHKTFTPVTLTLFEDHKISIEEWIDFLYGLLSYESFSNISRNNKDSLNTTIYWLNKLF